MTVVAVLALSPLMITCTVRRAAGAQIAAEALPG